MMIERHKPGLDAHLAPQRVHGLYFCDHFLYFLMHLTQVKKLQ